MTTETATKTTTHCKRCGRILTAAKSVAQGAGPVCQAKIDAALTAAAKTQPAVQVEKATEALADNAVAHRTHNLYQVVSSNGATVYDVDLGTGGCTCKAGQYGRRCWHLTAAAALAAA